MSRDHQDALIEQLLRESLGGDRPRDLTPRVMALAVAHDRTRRSWWISAGAAVAASIAIAIGIVGFWPRAYPSLEMGGDLELVNSNDLQRGSQLTTGFNRKGTLKIGGYVVATVGPETTLTVGGTNYKEVILLDEGHLGVEVTKKRGSFEIVVGPALVHVTGTKFEVDVRMARNEAESQLETKMRVEVTEGSVEVRGLGGGATPIVPGKPGEFTVSAKAFPNARVQALIEQAMPDAPLEGPDEVATQPVSEALRAAPEVPAEPPAKAPPTVAVIPETVPAKVSVTNDPPNTAGASTKSETRPGSATANADRRGSEPVASSGRGPVARVIRPANLDPKSIPLTVVVGAGRYEINGVFLKVEGYYVLRTERQFLLLGTADDIPKNAPAPGPTTRVQVNFAKGKVISIVPLTARPSTRPSSGRSN